MKNTFETKIEKLNLGEFGERIEEYIGYSENKTIDEIFIEIAGQSVLDNFIWDTDLLDWAKDHIEDVDEVIKEGAGNDLKDSIAIAIERVILDELYENKGDILLYYAFKYAKKKEIELDDEKIKALKEYIDKLGYYFNPKLEDIENYLENKETRVDVERIKAIEEKVREKLGK